MLGGLLDGVDPVRAAVAGAAASVAYAVEMYADKAATGSQFDDVQLIEGAIRRRTARLPVLGMALHLLNGAALGEVYAVLGARFLPGPAWLKGFVFSELFILVAWPSVPLIDRIHPLIRQGKLPRVARPIVFAQNLLRHAAFGLVLGALYGR